MNKYWIIDRKNLKVIEEANYSEGCFDNYEDAIESLKSYIREEIKMNREKIDDLERRNDELVEKLFTA